MSIRLIFMRFLKNQLRCMSSSKPKNHYESLGLPSGSTQNEIKSAYYKLSMLYHPDKNQGNIESSQKFRDITEAYEVLGNVKSRKLYDKGLFVGGSVSYPTREEPVDKSRDTQYRPPAPSGRTPVYDFDEWSKMHYGATFRKMQANKRQQKAYAETRNQLNDEAKVERVLFMLLFLFIISMYAFTDKTYDSPYRLSENSAKKSKNL